MSLDVYLKNPGASGPERLTIFIREDGQRKEISLEEWNKRFPGAQPVLCHVGGDDDVYSANITHNLGAMAGAAGIYEHLWRPDEIGITAAKQLIEPLRTGLTALRSDPDKFKVHNPSNGWGNYDLLIKFVEGYLSACEEHPDSIVSVSR
jgi:hypothetical protein